MRNRRRSTGHEGSSHVYVSYGQRALSGKIRISWITRQRKRDHIVAVGLFSQYILSMVFVPAIFAAIWIFGVLICLRLPFRNWRRPFHVIFFTYVLGGAMVMAGWMTLMCVWAVLGGNPSLGKAEAGHYFVGQHGVYREVSQQTYFRLEGTQRLIEKAAWCWFLLLPVGLVAGILIFGGKRTLDRFLGWKRQTPEDLGERQL